LQHPIFSVLQICGSEIRRWSSKQKHSQEYVYEVHVG
jgi:hypothetical protein